MAGVSLVFVGHVVALRAANAVFERNLADFGKLDPSGSIDMAPLFEAAIASVSPGGTVRIQVPNVGGKATYRLDSPVLSKGRFVEIDLTSGAGVGANFGGDGKGILYVQRVERHSSGFYDTEVMGSGGGVPAGTVPIFEKEHINNDLGMPAYGRVYHYQNTGVGKVVKDGGDIASASIAEWNNLRNGTAFWGQWLINVTPLTSAADVAGGASWGSNLMELNPVNNGPEPTFREMDSALQGNAGVPATYSAGLLIQPDRWDPSGGFGGSIQFSLGCFPYSGVNNRPQASADSHIPISPGGGYQAGTQSCLLVGNNSVSPGGHAIYLGGQKSATPALMPGSAIEVRHNWTSALDTTKAHFSDAPIHLGDGQPVFLDTAGKAGFFYEASGSKIVFISGGKRIASLDGEGNLVLKGKLKQNGAP